MKMTSTLGGENEMTVKACLKIKSGWLSEEGVYSSRKRLRNQKREMAYAISVKYRIINESSRTC